MVLFAQRFEKALSGFPPTVQAELYELAYREKVVPAKRVGAWLDMMGVEVASLMVQLLPVAAGFARVSHHQPAMGAVALASAGAKEEAGPGNLYLGANLEFQGQVSQLNVHSEQAAVLHAWMREDSGLEALAVQAPPCGACRQFLYEATSKPHSMRIFCEASREDARGSYTSHSLDYFLPDALSSKASAGSGGWMEGGQQSLNKLDGDSLVQHAWAAAAKSFAFTSGGYGGLALLRSDGKVYAGRRVEHVHLPHGLSPLASALAHLNMQLPPLEPLDIRRAVLVECPSASSQRELVRAGLAVVAPGIPLEYHLVEAPSGATA